MSWHDEEQKYRRLAARMLAALPAGTIAHGTRPTAMLFVSFDPRDPQAIDAAIEHLAAEVRKKGWSVYVPLKVNPDIEYGIALVGDGRAVRLIRVFDRDEMITRFDVALCKPALADTRADESQLHISAKHA